MFRKLLLPYVSATQRDKERIWHAFLSSIKLWMRTKAEQRSRQPPRPSTTPSPNPALLDRAIRACVSFLQRGYLSRACRRLDAVTRDHILPPEDIVAALQALHPAGAPPSPFPHSDDTIMVGVEELLAAAKHNCSGAAAGPSAITDEHLLILVQDEVTRVAMVRMLADVLNNSIAPSVRRRLTRCRLVALPKLPAGVRPVAVGETVVKLASTVLFNRYKPEIVRHFGDLQFGCMRKGGVEIVSHAIDRDFSAGMKLVTADIKNAFNTPLRDVLASALASTPQFTGFRRIFELEYGAASELLYFHQGSLYATLLSERGVRQGSALGGFFFSLALQSALVNLKLAFPTINVYAYLDDLSLTGTDDGILADALAFFAAEISSTGMALNLSKCEYFDPSDPFQLRHLSPAFPQDISRPLGCIKALGVFHGDAGCCARRLVEKCVKHRVFFDRLAQMKVGPGAFSLLAKCGLPRMNSFYIRTHPPAVIDEACALFDRFVDTALEEMFHVGADCRELISLPCNLGGLGVPIIRSIRSEAFEASRSFALGELHCRSGPEAPSQKDAVRLKNVALHSTLLSSGVIDERHSSEASRPHASRFLFAFRAPFGSPDAFVGAVRSRLRRPAVSAPPIKSCPGCQKLLPPLEFLVHVPGCAQITGVNCTVKHNVLVRLFAKFCAVAGVPCTIEPRSFQAYSCRSCGCLVGAGSPHGCRGALYRTGPDLQVFWPEGATIYDATVAHVTAASYSHRSVSSIVEEKIREKVEFYSPMMQQGDEFEVLLFYSLGGLHPSVLKLLALWHAVMVVSPFQIAWIR